MGIGAFVMKTRGSRRDEFDVLDVENSEDASDGVEVNFGVNGKDVEGFGVGMKSSDVGLLVSWWNLRNVGGAEGTDVGL